jgi:hypothetical protein
MQKPASLSARIPIHPNCLRFLPFPRGWAKIAYIGYPCFDRERAKRPALLQIRLEQMKAVQHELAEGFRQPRQFFHRADRVGQIAGKNLRQLVGKMSATLL